jgi:hypothetical protein
MFQVLLLLFLVILKNVILQQVIVHAWAIRTDDTFLSL